MSNAPRVIDRYALYGEMAAGGMATVHYGRLLGQVGFARTVAMKRLHPQFAKDPEFVAMFLDEARLAARIQHPNVVSTLDVVSTDGELVLVMEYVQGETLSRLSRALDRQGQRLPARMALAIVAGALHGLHAAHEARNERGEPLHIVHRDVSPQNIMIGTDGTARVLDFGVAKAVGRSTATREGQIKGKMAYMAPEQLLGDDVDRRTDVFAASVVLWEALTGRRLFQANSDVATLLRSLKQEIPPPSAAATLGTSSEGGQFGGDPQTPGSAARVGGDPQTPGSAARVGGDPQTPGSADPLAGPMAPAIDALVMRGLARDPAARWGTARDMAVAIEQLMALPTAREIGDWVERTASSSLAQRAAVVAEIESDVGPRGPLTKAAPEASPSELSTVPHSGPARAAASARHRGVALVAALVVVAGLVVGTLALRDPASPPPANAATGEAPAVSASSPVDKPTNSAASPTASASALGETPKPPPRAIEAPPPHASAGVSATAETRSRGAGRATPPHVDRCHPPYTVSADGIRRFKPECL